MASQKPWEKDWSAPSAAPQGIIVKDADPRRQYEAPLAQIELARKQADFANAPFDRRKSAADARRAEAEASMSEQKSEAQRAEAALATMTASSDVHGDAYLQKYVPAAMRETVKAYARGDVGSRSGGLSTSMLPIIQHALNYDPTASATTFPARVKMQSDLAGSQPGTAGGALRAMERMLLHGREVLTAGQKLDNFGPGLLGTIGNTVRTGYERATHDPAISGYEELVRNYAPEAQKAIAQTSGGVAERTERGDAFGASLPQAARVAALQGDARQAFDAMGAVNGQYKRLMGRDILDQLSPEAKQAYDLLMSGGYDDQGKALHPAAGYTPGSIMGTDTPGAPPAGPAGDSGGPPAFRSAGPGGGPPGGGGTGGQAVATGQYRDVYNSEVSLMTDRLIRQGKTAAQINEALGGGRTVNQADVTAAQAYLRKNPGYKGVLGESVDQVPTTAFERASASAPAAAALGAYNGLTAGFSDELAGGANALLGGSYTDGRDAFDAKKRALAQLHPYADIAGNVAGGALAMAAPMSALAGAGMGAGKILAPGAMALDAAYGGLYGAGQNNDDRLGGAVGGALGGAVGGVAGRSLAVPVAAAGRSLTARGMAFRGFPNAATPPPAPLNASDAMILSAAQKAGVPDVRAQLSQAQALGVPMALADTHPALTSLAGAAVRRSPNADALAQGALLPRSRGQIDRFGQAVTRDLGPVDNIPQMSADMTAQARAAAGPLYDRAYAQPVMSTPELDATLATPFGRQALSRAQTIAANERRSPTELGFAQDAQGNTLLNPRPNQAIAQHLAARGELDAAQAAYKAARSGAGNVDQARAQVEVARDKVRAAEQGLRGAPDPSQPASVPGYTTQTLDYVKRGMDDVLEQQRNPLTGRLQLDEAGRAQNGVRQQFLGEVDRLNPAYRDARGAYAGPVSARDALTRGQDAFGMHPDELGMQVANQTPEHLAQMQLGYRDAMMTRANGVRHNSNPFEATLGTPVAEQRLSTLYPNNPGNSNLLAQRDMEGRLARSTNDILGNSKTAQRGIADQAFQGGALPGLAMDAGLMAMGQIPTTTIARHLGGGAIRDALTMGLGKRAVTRADAMAPSLFNTDPGAAASLLDDLANQSQSYRDYVLRSRQRVSGPLGMFGSKAGPGYALGQ